MIVKCFFVILYGAVSCIFQRNKQFYNVIPLVRVLLNYSSILNSFLLTDADTNHSFFPKSSLLTVGKILLKT